MARLAFLLSAASALVATSLGNVIPRQAAAFPVFTFPTGSFAENLAVRSNGQILVTLMTTSELWQVDPGTKNASRLFKFPSGSTSGITEYAPDQFAVIVGNSLWKVNMNATPPAITNFMNGTGWGTVNGMTTLNSDTVVLADANKASIYTVSMTTGAVATVLTDVEALGGPANATFSFGIDGIRPFNGSLFFTNIQKGTIGRIPVNATGYPTGPIEMLKSGLVADDFAVAPDGTLYMGAGRMNAVVKLAPDWRGPETIASTIPGPTAVQWGRAMWDNKNLYVTSQTGALFTFTPA